MTDAQIHEENSERTAGLPCLHRRALSKGRYPPRRKGRSLHLLRRAKTKMCVISRLAELIDRLSTIGAVCGKRNLTLPPMRIARTGPETGTGRAPLSRNSLIVPLPRSPKTSSKRLGDAHAFDIHRDGDTDWYDEGSKSTFSETPDNSRFRDFWSTFCASL